MLMMIMTIVNLTFNHKYENMLFFKAGFMSGEMTISNGFINMESIIIIKTSNMPNAITTIITCLIQAHSIAGQIRHPLD